MANEQIPTSSKSREIKVKKFKKIPIFVVENHNDILELVLPALANNYLPFQNNLLIHFDSHPDCCINRQMPAETIFSRTALLENLSIENWIIPLLYGGHFEEIAWVRPPFAHQIPDGSYKFFVGNDHKNRIGVSSNLDYFLSDGSYINETELKNKKEVKLIVTEIHDSFNEIVKEKTFILDIDLDYFSTHNPFLNIYPKAQTYEKLKEIYKMDKNYDVNDPSSLTKFVNERNKQLNFFDTIFQHMAQHGSLEKYKFNDDASLREKFERTKELIDCLCHHYSIYDIDWFIVNDAGCTVDDELHQLPHYESSEEEIKEMMTKFENFLRSLKRYPEIITISRSSHDDYCPSNQVEMIQTSVIKALQNVFAEELKDQPTFWYKNSSNISALELVEPRIKQICHAHNCPK
ncbi:hypothetical protein PVAND_004224 [Polypedilum vanderplanki]|uniref:Uncharacterized protein n=1 Tax=Polypedilum vanderplanki TaxID=319348 RepID=A0A9J6BWH5_POLVA|nr:hypothetical protein PVAND_004224 [Polypedilum vanderplanki]